MHFTYTCIFGGRSGSVVDCLELYRKNCAVSLSKTLSTIPHYSDNNVNQELFQTGEHLYVKTTHFTQTYMFAFSQNAVLATHIEASSDSYQLRPFSSNGLL